jgi:hypothetical protein
MDKNSINQVARTYQRLVEAAQPSPQLSSSVEMQPATEDVPYMPRTFDTGPTYPNLGAANQAYYNQVVDMLDYCLSNPGACSQEQIDRLNWLLQYYTNFLRGTGY